MGLTVERLGAGQSTRTERSTASRCYVVMAGSGSSTVGDKQLAWSRGDSFAVPTWVWNDHKAAEDAQLFCLSDEPLMRFARYFRHEVR